jgi:glyoxylase-like metal-dependent hydrolase (beta-lactamase superfamily II)/rhodanese-related sulfurtransferase
MTARKKFVWTPAQLHEHLQADSRFAILDVRNGEEFKASRIEGKSPIKTVNIPYFDLLDLAEEDEEIAAAVARAAPDRLKGRLPRSGTLLVVCARGDTSAHVAEGLRRLDRDAVNLAGGMAAWGDHYETRIVEQSARLTILQISRPARGCLSYMLASGGVALVVDPARHTGIYRKIAAEREWRIAGVLDTHLQADHLSGGVALAKAAGVDYRLHPYDGIHPEELLPATFAFRYLEDETVITLGEVSVRVLHRPGHTLGMVNLLVDDRYLLTGDTLFINSIGRPDLCGQAKSWAPLLYRSLQRLLALPARTVVLPAHFSHMREADAEGCYRASIGALRGHNEGLRMFQRGEAAFSAYIMESLPEHPPAYDDIRRANTGLLKVDAAKASELELGHNQCALAQGKEEKRKAA